MSRYPERIVCLTEESVETLFLLGEERRIIGVSGFVERPPEAKKIKKVSAFTSANIEKIIELKPDLVLGFSDIQKDIARDLIGEGLNVFISNHRSLEEIFNYVLWLGSLVGKRSGAEALVAKLEKQVKLARDFSKTLKTKPRCYLEEWDEPAISGIKWFSQIIEVCGGEDIFKEKAEASLAKDRFVNFEEVRIKNPEIIFPCWCGKKVDLESIKNRNNFDKIKAVQNNKVIELDPTIFLQPGPAPIIAGIPIIMEYFKDFA